MTLRGRRHGPYTVEGARWYGSVCNVPRQVVVQVEISGTINHELPSDAHRLDQLEHEIRAAFEHRGWPSICTIAIEFDSVERLREGPAVCGGVVATARR